jgi:hypothetical protein
MRKIVHPVDLSYLYPLFRLSNSKILLKYLFNRFFQWLFWTEFQVSVSDCILKLYLQRNHWICSYMSLLQEDYKQRGITAVTWV